MELPTKVIVVVGMGRSGSTLLSRLLGITPGVLDAGVMQYFWEKRAAQERNFCGCGERVANCPFWSEVLARAFGDSPPDLRTQARLERRSEKDRNLPLALLRPLRIADADRAQAASLEAMERLIPAAVEVAGARVFVDSSKVLSRAILLRRSPRFTVSVIHLVRDSRGTVAAWARGSTSAASPAKRPIRRIDPHTTAFRWLKRHLLAEICRPALGPVLRVRYEDLATDPVGTIDRVLSFAGIAARPVGLEADGFDASPSHQVGGNPMKAASGLIAIRLDEQWKSELSTRTRLGVTCATFPLLLRYRYPLWPRRPAG